jgi:hypothetical protein
MRVVNRAENWERAYQAFQQVNFSAWDASTIKQSLVDYLKLYFPEDFNDFIESSELIMILEMFAYLGELIAYRLDLNAHENFMTIAERKESVLRLAKWISYNASRNIPARGLVKITSITTTERVFDSRGADLSNKIVLWNDPNNSNWKEQFIVILNKILEQNFGTVTPSDRVQVQDVLFELYGLNNEPLQTQTISYNITVSGNQYPMELVSAHLNEFGPLEKRPQLNQKINILYLNDGLGDSSDNTGFFLYTKQGQLQRTTAEFDGVTPNQTFDVLIANSNETDVWVNNIDSDTGQIIVGSDVRSSFRAGEWERVDLANAQNILFNTSKNRNKYELETLTNDQFRILFGDGQFANIPKGTFDIWSRTSANEDLVIPTNAIQNLSASVFYVDAQNKRQTFTFTFSLTNTIQNAAVSEDIEHIRRVAPSVYYTQDRMVNGRDCNEFPLQDNSILKLRSINRTFAGDSNYIAWHDPKQNYENVKMYGSDLALYFKTEEDFVLVNNSQLPATDGGANIARIAALIDNYIQPLLSSQLIVIKEMLAGVVPVEIRKTFTDNERLMIEAALTTSINSSPSLFFLNYFADTDTWQVSYSEPAVRWIAVTAYNNGDFALYYYGHNIIAHSDNMKFYVTNNGAKVLNYDTLNNDLDRLVLLKANVGTSGVLSQNYEFFVIQQDVVDGGPDAGSDSIHDLVVLPVDANNDGAPDDVTLEYLINQATDKVYFQRTLEDSVSYSQWELRDSTSENIAAYQNDVTTGAGLWKVEIGKSNLNFLWLHSTPRYHLVDPASSNIIDMYVITRGYYTNLRLWLNGRLDEQPELPTPFELRNDYNYLLDNKMISDTIILHPGRIKVIIGQNAADGLKATIKIVKSSNSTLTNNQIKAAIVDAVVEYFDINFWEFGETFYFPELSTYIQTKLPVDIDAVVIVPVSVSSIIGDLYQVYAQEDEIIQPSISVNDIEIVDSLDPRSLRKT